MVKATYFLEVISSWCYWAEPTWAELKRRYQGKVAFDWKIAQMPADAYPVSKAQCDWFYRRSGSIVRSPFMLNSGWFDPAIKQWLAPNYITEAARDLGAADDRVRLAIAHAALREGKKVGRWEEVGPIVAAAAGIDQAKLVARAQSAEIQQCVESSSREFDALQVNQRPTFLIQNAIGDRAVFSGLVRLEALAAAIEALLADEEAYVSWKAHFGDVPAS
jgi:predicted DsbA family dithiol-disulfide isomerase